MSASNHRSNELISHRVAVFQSAIERLGLKGTLRSIEAAKASRDAVGDWNLKELKHVFDTFRREAASLDGGMRSGILLLNGLWLELQSCKTKARQERDVF